MVSTVAGKRLYRGRFTFVIMAIIVMGCLEYGAARSCAADPLFATTTGTGIICSQENPCNLTTAVFLAADNQFVYVAGGIYTGTMDPFLTIDKDIRLTGGWDGAGSGTVNLDSKVNSTVLDGEGSRRVMEVRSMATPIISGLTIRRGYHTLRGGGMDIDDTPLLQIQDTVFYDNSAGSYGGGLYIGAGTLEIYNCRFEANEVAHGGGALMLGSSSNATIARNTFTSNIANYGSALSVDDAFVVFYNNYVLGNLGPVNTSAIIVSGPAGHVLTFYNNIIAGNAGDGISLMQHTLRLFHNTIAFNSGNGLKMALEAHAELTNNSFSGHTGLGKGSINKSDTSVIDSSSHNLFWNNSNDPHTGASPVIGAPKFTDDYHLRPGSAAIDSGTATAIHGDIDQEARPRGDAPDIGADEASFPDITPILLQLLD